MPSRSLHVGEVKRKRADTIAPVLFVLFMILPFIPSLALADCVDEMYHAQKVEREGLDFLKRQRIAEGKEMLEEALFYYQEAYATCRLSSRKQESILSSMKRIRASIPKTSCIDQFYKVSHQKEAVALARFNDKDWVGAREAYEDLAKLFDAVAESCKEPIAGKSITFAAIARDNRDQASCMARIGPDGEGDVAFRSGERGAQNGNWEQAVVDYQTALDHNQWVLDHCQDERQTQTAWFNVRSSTLKLQHATQERDRQRCMAATAKAISVPGADQVERHLYDTIWWERAKPVLGKQIALYTEASRHCDAQPSRDRIRSVLQSVTVRYNEWGCKALTARGFEVRQDGEDRAGAGKYEEAMVRFKDQQTTLMEAEPFCRAQSGVASRVTYQRLREILANNRCRMAVAQVQIDYAEGLSLSDAEQWAAAERTFLIAASDLKAVDKTCQKGMMSRWTPITSNQIACQASWSAAMNLSSTVRESVRKLEWDKASERAPMAVSSWHAVRENCPKERSERASANLDLLQSRIIPRLQQGQEWSGR
ncbi:MAG: hypothetical protein HQL50_00510 [Magnetococcales bacterium]|nr:hypothetical protein [Magnetococcales bacterium]